MQSPVAGPKTFAWILLLVLASTGLVSAQKGSNWRVYKASDGMPESACSALYFSPQGKILARHLNVPFVSELDGFRINVIPGPQLGKGRVYQSPGGQLWSIAGNGLEEFQGTAWAQHKLPGLSEGTSNAPAEPLALYPVRQDLVLALLPDVLLEIDTQRSGPPRIRVLKEARQTGLGRFTGLTRARSSGLWITGANGAARVPGPLRNLLPETAWTEYLVSDSLPFSNLREPVELGPPGAESQAETQVIVTALADCRTNNSKCLLTLEAGTWTAARVEDPRFSRAWRGPDRSCWFMAGEGLWQAQDPQADANECEEISARKYFDVAIEPSGAFWVASAEGLFRYAPLLWQTERPLRKINTPVRCIASDQDKRLCFASGNRLYALQGETLRDFPLPMLPGGRPVQARMLFLTQSGALLLAAEDPSALAFDLLFRFEPEHGTFSPVIAEGSRLKALGLLKDGSLCIQRTGGSDSVLLEKLTGSRFDPLIEKPPVNLGKHYLCAFPAQNGDLWISTELGTGCLHEGEWRTYLGNDKSNPEGSSCFVESLEGKIWCAVEDGIWEFDGRKWNSLRRGFDRINDIIRTRDGSMWVATNNGLLRYLREAWVETGLEDGLASTTVRDLFENERGLWAATSRGLSLFHPEVDPESDPPQTFIQKLSELGSTAGPEGGTVTITFSGRDKWKYTARERLLFSYRIDDRDWTAFQENTRITLTDLSPGTHYFQVRSMDRNCNIDPRPAQLEFAMVLPWYKETRLVLIACAGAAAALFFAAVAFNRHRQLVRSYAEVEAKVAERTHELEITSQELFHSQKMNALGTLAAGIAHDFNNILSIIKGSAQIIEENVDSPDKIRLRTDRIKTVVEQGAGIVKAMLGFSRESGALDSDCDVNGIVQETLKLLGDRFLREVEVHFVPGSDLPHIPGSKDMIQQILLNFIFNAAESMEGRKVVRLETAVTPQLPSELVLTPGSAPRFIVISVQDTGCGISRDNLPRIFEPFFTTKAMSARRGTGLGLSMVYELARKLNAGLCVESTIGQGSTFALLLPVPA